jgi:HEPN domain-containing protein
MNDNLNVNEWIRFAQMDYDAAINMSRLHRPVPLEIVCYHCQQSVEKILKAYLLARDEPLQRTHDLNLLLNKCVKYDEAFDEYAAACIALTSYAVLTRYPVGEGAINERDMQTALKSANEILEFSKDRIAQIQQKMTER